MKNKQALKKLLSANDNIDKTKFIEKTAFIGNLMESWGKRFGSGATASLQEKAPEITKDVTNSAIDTAKERVAAPIQEMTDKVKDFAGFTRGSMYTIPTAIIGALLMYNMLNKDKTTGMGQVGSAFAGAALGTLTGSPAFSRWLKSLKTPKASQDNFGIS